MHVCHLFSVVLCKCFQKRTATEIYFKMRNVNVKLIKDEVIHLVSDMRSGYANAVTSLEIFV